MATIIVLRWHKAERTLTFTLMVILQHVKLVNSNGAHGDLWREICLSRLSLPSLQGFT